MIHSIWVKNAAAAMTVLLVLAAAGCGGDKKAEVGKTAAKDTLKVGVPGFAESLETAGRSSGRAVVRYGIGETLVKFDRKMHAGPWLAESWKLSDDRLTWTFRINDRAVFSNGNKVTGDAVAKSLLRTLDKVPRARAMLRHDSIKGEGLDVIIRTRTPVPNLPGMLGDPLFLIADTSAKDRDHAAAGPVGTGPYVVKSFNREKVLLAANEHYWDGKVPFKNLEILSVDDSNARAMALRKGEIDAAVDVASGDMALFRDNAAFRISETGSFRDVLARISVKEGKPLADKRVREALVSSLDRTAYCKVLLRDTFIPGGPLLPPAADCGYDELMGQDRNRYNTERARKLLAEAGWKDTDGDGYVDKGGRNLEVNFTYCGRRAEMPLFAEAVRSDARRNGIKVSLKNIDDKEMDIVAATGGYDLLVSDVLTEPAGDPEEFMNRYWKTGRDGSNPQNGSGYSSPGFDALSDKLSVEFDPVKRRQLVIAMQKIIMEDCAAIVFGHPQVNVITGTSVANADAQPCDYYWITKDWTPAAAK